MSEMDQSTARRGSLPIEQQPVEDSASAGAGSSSSVVFGVDGGHEGNNGDPASEPIRSRLEQIFAMLSVIDSNDEMMLRRLESELLRIEAGDLQQDAVHFERDIDERIDSDLTLLNQSESSQSSRHELQQLLLTMGDATGDLRQSAFDDMDIRERSDDRSGHDDNDEAEPEVGDDGNEFLDDNQEYDQLTLPSGSPLSNAHIDVISHALHSARIALHLDVPSTRMIVVHSEQSPTSEPATQGSRRASNASEPDRERDDDREQIEGYEGDRAHVDDGGHEMISRSEAGDTRVAIIIETLKAVSAAGMGAEELDDFMLHGVLAQRAGPAMASTASDDQIGDEQMRLYQECIAVVDDFLDLLTMMNEEDNDEMTEETNDPTQQSGDFVADEMIQRPRIFSRGSS